ncbi:hypothetical protein [Geotalea uraniireducens]|uniref:Uncharacterized protein n=1 Tax=Geotalea uraniireducens (strain Rf4) TaxID=351605 RepID=A5G7K6_GEOUR|nr:hypothetical protein [Geotalea uraniireducens]ABQ27774.1 hypothetical protein Gura_3620 [Geotalea uraniireducens Rf4]
MIYLTNDALDQAVYFDLRKQEPRKKGGGVEHLFYGLLGNGVSEVPVIVRSWRDCLEMVFGRGDLFTLVEEKAIRRMLGEVVREMVLH